MAAINPFRLKDKTEKTLLAAETLLANNKRLLQEKGFPYEGIERGKSKGVKKGIRVDLELPEEVKQYHFFCARLDDEISRLTLIRDWVLETEKPVQLKRLKEIYAEDLKSLFDVKKIEEMKNKKNRTDLEERCITIANNKIKPLEEQLDRDFMLVFLQEKYNKLNDDFQLSQSHLKINIDNTGKTEFLGSKARAFEEFLKNPDKPKETLEQLKEKIGSDSMIEDEAGVEVEDVSERLSMAAQPSDKTGEKKTIADLSEGEEVEEDWDAPEEDVPKEQKPSKLFTPALDRTRLQDKEKSPEASSPSVGKKDSPRHSP